jgi:hypothetical protein
MTKILERIEGHYEVDEGPFSRAYVWHPAYVTLECECGERFTLTATSTTATCRCGIDHISRIRGIQEREARLTEKIKHPWHHDAQEQAQQHQRDEVDYTEDSPWRYNDVTAGLGDNEERWTTATARYLHKRKPSTLASVRSGPVKYLPSVKSQLIDTY